MTARDRELKQAQDRLQQLEHLRRQIEAEITGTEATINRLTGVKAVRRSRNQPPKCGTEAGYQWHRYRSNRHGIGVWPLPVDDPCGCRAAHAVFWHARKDGGRSAESAAGLLGAHRRWHVGRDLIDPDCAHCRDRRGLEGAA